jgi:hypothetical protein
MNEDTLDRAVEQAKHGHTLIATCDADGIPHIAAAGALAKPENGQLALTDWFCPRTVENALPGRSVSIVIWNPESDTGHQLIATVVRIDEVSMLNGYTPDETVKPVPQSERRLVVDVIQALEFCKAPHNDVAE